MLSSNRDNSSRSVLGVGGSRMDIGVRQDEGDGGPQPSGGSASFQPAHVTSGKLHEKTASLVFAASSTTNINSQLKPLCRIASFWERLISQSEDGLPWVLLCKARARKDAHRSDACEEDDRCQAASARNLSGAKQDDANDQIEECPDHVHDRRRQAFSRRLGERRWEPVARYAIHEMRHGVR